MAHYKGAADEALRAMQLKKKREQALQDLELRKKKIEEETKVADIGGRFATHHDSAIEAHLRASTVGLVTLDEMRIRQEEAAKERAQQLVQLQEEKNARPSVDPKELQEKHRRQRQALSFQFDDDEDDEDDEEDGSETLQNKQDDSTDIHNNEASICATDIAAGTIKKDTIARDIDSDSNSRTSLSDQPKKKKKMLKNPDVDTSFLPDREREEEERRLREELRLQWQERQEKLKEEEIEITFSYWDGSGHRRVVKMKKGHSIYQFLQKCLEQLRREFNELRSISADQLMYVKEDLIIPHRYTFYDFIVTKARGKSGPLFSFDVHDDVRLKTDATVEKDESHAGKVLLRSWYERNKHIFPASRWEAYDPTKTYDKYTISDKKGR